MEKDYEEAIELNVQIDCWLGLQNLRIYSVTAPMNEINVIFIFTKLFQCHLNYIFLFIQLKRD